MNYSDIKERIVNLGHYDDFLNIDWHFISGDPDDSPETISMYNKHKCQNVSDILEHIELFEIEVIPHIKIIIKNGTSENKEYLKAFLESTIQKLNDFKNTYELTDNDFLWLFNEYKVELPLSTVSLIKTNKYQTELNEPIEDYYLQFYKSEALDKNIKDNAFRAAIYITVLMELLLKTLKLFTSDKPSFQLRNYETNKSFLKELFVYSNLNESELLNFMNLFSGTKPINPINWHGYLGDLKTIIETMQRKNLFVNLGVKKHWDQTILCFKDKYGQDIKKSKLSKGDSTSNDKSIRDTIAKMNNKISYKS